MPEPGGPSAIYGILYQILANLWRVSEIRLESKLAGQEIRSALLILEPKGGGGDARYEGEMRAKGSGSSSNTRRAAVIAHGRSKS
jgi:hypothetical protein